MTIRTIALTASLAAAIPLAALAQQAPKLPQSTPAAQAPAQNTQTPATPPPSPVRTEIVKFDNWTATCNDFTEGPHRRVCTAQLQVQQTGSNQVVLSWGVFIKDGKELVAALQTPTGVAIAPGVKVKLDKGAERTFAYESCDTGNCTATQVIDNNLLRDINASGNVQITVQAINGNQVNFSFPMKGADKAIAHIRAAR